MEITTKLIQELREKTGCGMMDCKKALTESKGDFELAIDYLRKKGIAAAARRADRTAAQGLIESYIHLGSKIGVLTEINCETDFVAKNTDFQQFAKDICLQVAAANPLYVTRDEVPDGAVDHETEILATQARNEGKPEKAIEKIIQGRIEKYYAEVCLLDQPFIRDQKKTIKDLLGELVAKIGENIVIRRFTRYQLGEKS
ncbi:translation elongation factor Ts [candidate division WOR-1 bacterium RIFOXYB2_FULL_48_7]|uniref:Elongation factor Ts n=1 Tax=candidate division WOR-1 bacterium RIFOXYB2_FULL_48_7 TaxID=1802583 RepID=A0A1F4TS24_UNCSA|nr:MAG: translation elongation factor Ts [candidate division WOR-1 bacterium RIFOXYB2_FULL_48_7]